MRRINYFDKAFELISVVAGIASDRTPRFDGKYFRFHFSKYRQAEMIRRSGIYYFH